MTYEYNEKEFQSSLGDYARRIAKLKEDEKTIEKPDEIMERAPTDWEKEQEVLESQQKTEDEEGQRDWESI